MNSKGVRSPHIVFINGPISSGKDTQAELLIKGDSKAMRISPGDLIRDARSEDHPLHGILKSHLPVLDSGKLVPAKVMVDIVIKMINSEMKNGREIFVITGFPRSLEYLDVLEPVLARYQEELGAKIDFVYLDITPSESWRRTQLRRRSYIERGLDPRPEDTREKFKGRSDVFEKETLPAMQRLFCDERIFKVRAMGKAEETQTALREKLMWDELHPRREGSLPAAARR